ncbi:hypothetical protein MIND_01232600 [Mycena indigotica]|uniref:DUF7223 domain-containing protein n=1 Tax=Mycena indigotica TaxID=2126181 RepID=A0A8H6S4H5_9AGAR|nr:uncharacterized protein MIND_01232600 [Mycena indigotica]KAF7292065.1 hypothetical protein MIND_01232600 [Mycena indigotica]
MLSLLLLLAPVSALAARNNWNKACRGSCAYDLPNSGVLSIVGGDKAVSDITSAGGWSVLSCDANALSQHIRLVCNSAACEHLFEGHGAVNTVVRLPESCGANPFARVASVKVDSNQSIPGGAKSKRAAGKYANTVFLIRVDTDFAKVDASVTGPVEFRIEGYNYQGTVTAPAKDIARRGDNPTGYNNTLSSTLPPIKLNQKYPLFSGSVNCPNFTASVATALNVDVDLTVSLGLVVAGTVIPADITQFAVFGGLDGHAGARLSLDATALGTYSTGKVPLYSVALAGVDVPGIFTLGPTFDLLGKADANIKSGDLSIGVDLKYNVANARAYIPPQPSAVGGFNPDNSQLTLSVQPSIKTSGTVSGHLIPQLTLGLNAFSGIAKAQVYLNLDASTGIDLSLSASANASTGTSGNAASGTVDGCVDISAGLGVNVGASGSLFGLIGEGEYPLYSGAWDLYAKCFSAASKRAPEPGRGLRRIGLAGAGYRLPGDARQGLAERAAAANGLTCPTSSSKGQLVTIIEQIVGAVKKP